jgi:hypothetical protein
MAVIPERPFVHLETAKHLKNTFKKSLKKLSAWITQIVLIGYSEVCVHILKYVCILEARSNMAFKVELKSSYWVSVGTSCKFIGMFNTPSGKGHNMLCEFFVCGLFQRSRVTIWVAFELMFLTKRMICIQGCGGLRMAKHI